MGGTIQHTSQVQFASGVGPTQQCCKRQCKNLSAHGVLAALNSAPQIFHQSLDVVVNLAGKSEQLLDPPREGIGSMSMYKCVREKERERVEREKGV